MIHLHQIHDNISDEIKWIALEWKRQGRRQVLAYNSSLNELYTLKEDGTVYFRFPSYNRVAWLREAKKHKSNKLENFNLSILTVVE